MLPVAFIVGLVIRALIAATKNGEKTDNGKTVAKRRRAMKLKFKKTRITNGYSLFNGHFVDVKAFYAACFKRVPCVSFIGEIDISEAYSAIKECCAENIIDTYQHSYFDHDAKQAFFNSTIIVLTGERMIEMAGNYCQLLHTPSHYNWSRWLMQKLAAFRTPETTSQAPVYTRIVGFAGATELN